MQENQCGIGNMDSGSVQSDSKLLVLCVAQEIYPSCY